ncbi:MAG TPA: HupE/UreJ family protein [Pseudolabrys sp.]|nr:HupE/UreJ family protein [Pseudolabrys sp.]
MNSLVARLVLGFIAAALGGAPAFAHHLMGGHTPSTFTEGVLSGLGHPVIGLDHLAAVIAVGCLAAVHRSGSALAAAFVLAMMGGVALHVHGSTVPGGEMLVALSVLALGAMMILRQDMRAPTAFAIFIAVGLVHGYALGESIFGAESTPLFAYLLGLVIIQAAICVGAVHAMRGLMRSYPDLSPLRLVGAGIAGIGLAVLMQQIVPAV